MPQARNRGELQILLLYYPGLDVPPGLAMCAAFALILWGAEALSQAPCRDSLAWLLALRIGNRFAPVSLRAVGFVKYRGAVSTRRRVGPAVRFSSRLIELGARCTLRAISRSVQLWSRLNWIIRRSSQL